MLADERGEDLELFGHEAGLRPPESLARGLGTASRRGWLGIAVSDEPVKDLGNGFRLVAAPKEGDAAESAVLVPKPGLRGGWRGGAELLRQGKKRMPDIMEDAVNWSSVGGDEFIFVEFEQMIGVPDELFRISEIDGLILGGALESGSDPLGQNRWLAASFSAFGTEVLEREAGHELKSEVADAFETTVKQFAPFLQELGFFLHNIADTSFVFGERASGFCGDRPRGGHSSKVSYIFLFIILSRRI